ncbi:MAG: RHS repeat-associated core domain-containing protein [candidate division WOR-3 bacterium]
MRINVQTFIFLLVVLCPGHIYGSYYEGYLKGTDKLEGHLILDSVINSRTRDVYDYFYPGNPSFLLPTQNFNPENAFLPFSQEKIDLATGNLVIREPLIYYPGRNGLNFELYLIYNSGFWRYDCSAGGYFYGKGTIPSVQLQPCGIGWDIIMGELHLTTYKPYAQDWSFLPEYSLINIPNAGIKSRVIKGKLINDNSIEYRIENNPEWRIVPNSGGYGYIAIAPSGIKYYFGRSMTYYRRFFWDHYTLETEIYFVTKIEDSNGNYISIYYYIHPNGQPHFGHIGNEYDDNPYQNTATYYDARLLDTLIDTKGTKTTFHRHRYVFYYNNWPIVVPIYDSISYIGFDRIGNSVLSRIKFLIQENVQLGGANEPFNGRANLLNKIFYTNYAGSFNMPPKLFGYDEFGCITAIMYPTTKIVNGIVAGGRRIFNYTMVKDNTIYYRRILCVTEDRWGYPQDRVYYYFGDNTPGNMGWDNNNIEFSSVVMDRTTGDGYLYSVNSYRKTKVYYSTSGNFDIYYFLDRDDTQNFDKKKSLWGTCWKVEHYDAIGNLLAKEEYGYDVTVNGVDCSDPAHFYPWPYKQLRGEYRVKGDTKIFTRYDNYTKYNQWKTKTEYGFISYLDWGSFWSNPYVVDAGVDRRITTRSFLWESNSNYINGKVFLIDRIVSQQLKDNTDNLVFQVQYEYDNVGYNDYYNYYTMYPNYPPGQHTTQGQYRGNLTKFKQGLKEGNNWTWITTHYKYDCCGNIVRIINPLGYETSYRYDVDFGHPWQFRPDEYKYAHLRKIAKYVAGDSVCEGARWYFNQGLIMNYCGSNTTEIGQSWKYIYDHLNRLIRIYAPNVDYYPTKAFYYSYFKEGVINMRYNFLRVYATMKDDMPDEYDYQYYIMDYLGRFFQYQRRNPYFADSTWNVNYYYTDRGLKAKVSKQFNSQKGEYDGWPSPGPMLNGYTEYKYDAIDRLIEHTHPPGTNEQDRIHYTYTNNQVTVTDENDHQKRNTYDAYGRIAQVEQILNNTEYTTEYQYDALGNLIKVSNNNGQFVITYNYDALSRLIQKNDPNTGITKYVYDDCNNLRFIQDANHANNNSWVYKKYDALGRLTEEGEMSGINPTRVEANNPDYPTNGSWRIKRFYDQSYNGSTNPKGNLVRELISKDGINCEYMAVYSYDKRGRVISKTVYRGDNPIGGLRIGYEYDAQDNLIKIVYPDDETIVYKLNGLMLCDTVKTGGDIWLAKIHYKENEKPDSIITRGYAAGFSYYLRDWLDKIRLNGSVIRDYDYDNVGNVSFEARDGYNATYGYDYIYRLINEQYTGEINKNIIYSYNYLHNRIQMIEDGDVTNYQYTPNTSRLVSAGPWDCVNDASGNLISCRNYQNMYNYRNELIKRQRMDTPKDEKVINEVYTYLYDGKGNRVKMVTQGIGGSKTFFITDEQNRVIYETDDTPNLLKNPNFENGTNWAPWWTYTPQGSCTWTLVSDVVKSGFYAIRGTSKPEAGEGFYQTVHLADCPVPMVASVYIKTQDLTNGARLQVDFYNGSSYIGSKCGNLITGTTDWVQAILPIYASDIPSGTTQIIVFVVKFAGTGTCWIDNFRLEGGTVPSPNEAKYVYLNNTHLCKIDAFGEPYFYLCDALGSPIKIMNKNWVTIKSESFRAFGEQLTSVGSFKNTHRFTGKEYENSGVYYFGARYYDPWLGRFLTPDPLGKFDSQDPRTLNPYIYCLNNPVRFIDPDGELPLIAAYGIGVAVGVTADIVIKNQLFNQSGYTWKDFGIAVAAGISSGGVATLGSAIAQSIGTTIATRLAVQSGVGAVGNAVIGMGVRAVSGQKTNIGDVVKDAVFGGIAQVAGEGANKVISRVLPGKTVATLYKVNADIANAAWKVQSHAVKVPTSFTFIAQNMAAITTDEDFLGATYDYLRAKIFDAAPSDKTKVGIE